MKTPAVWVVIPNWNGRQDLPAALESLLDQSCPAHIIVVENGSTDGSLQFLQQTYPQVELVIHHKNLGFAGGVNAGIRRALDQGAQAIALFNNDAVADKHWLKHLVSRLDAEPEVGIVTSKIVDINNKHFDSTGDFYTTWGLPYPRGRGEPVSAKYDQANWVFSASGGASLYRAQMLRQVGLFDEDFFAYYEDVDLSFRAQLYGWKVYFEPRAVAYHQISATSSRIPGFTTYQTIKNLPWIYWKNLPWGLVPVTFVRFRVAYVSFIVSAFRRGQGWPATKGLVVMLALLPKKFWQRHVIQKHRRVSTDYIRSILVWDLPPNAHKLRRLRQLRPKHRSSR